VSELVVKMIREKKVEALCDIYRACTKGEQLQCCALLTGGDSERSGRLKVCGARTERILIPHCEMEERGKKSQPLTITTGLPPHHS